MKKNIFFNQEVNDQYIQFGYYEAIKQIMYSVEAQDRSFRNKDLIWPETGRHVKNMDCHSVCSAEAECRMQSDGMPNLSHVYCCIEGEQETVVLIMRMGKDQKKVLSKST